LGPMSENSDKLLFSASLVQPMGLCITIDPRRLARCFQTFFFIGNLLNDPLMNGKRERAVG
jgi:hypothetical protein